MGPSCPHPHHDWCFLSRCSALQLEHLSLFVQEPNQEGVMTPTPPPRGVRRADSDTKSGPRLGDSLLALPTAPGGMERRGRVGKRAAAYQEGQVGGVGTRRGLSRGRTADPTLRWAVEGVVAEDRQGGEDGTAGGGGATSPRQGGWQKQERMVGSGALRARTCGCDPCPPPPPLAVTSGGGGDGKGAWPFKWRRPSPRAGSRPCVAAECGLVMPAAGRVRPRGRPRARRPRTLAGARGGSSPSTEGGWGPCPGRAAGAAWGQQCGWGSGRRQCGGVGVRFCGVLDLLVRDRPAAVLSLSPEAQGAGSVGGGGLT